MLRDVILAYCFGTHEALAALFVALRFAHLARRLFGEGALQSAFIPLFEEIRSKNHHLGCRFFRDLSVLWTLLLIILSLFIAGALAIWSRALSSNSGMKEILDLMIIMAPSIIPTCLFGLNISFLQCQKQYFTAAVAPAFFNIVIIIVAAALSQGDPRSIMPLLSAGIVLACIAQWAVAFIPVLRECKATLKTELFSGIALRSPELTRLWHPLALGLLGIGASQINNAIDVIFARAADAQGPAQLWFSIRFQQLPLALFGIAIANAILPPLARAIQAGDSSKYHKFLEYGIRNVVSLLTPCTGLLIVAGMAMINCIYGHGDFHANSVIATTGCLQGYALALIPTGIILVLAPAFYAKGNYTIPMRGACLSLALNTALNSVMVFGLGWGAISVTIATSISAWINAAYLLTSLNKELGPILSHEGIVNCFRTMIASLAASVMTFIGIALWTCPPVLFSSWTTSGSLLPNTLTAQMIELGGAMGLFALCQLAAAKILRAQDILGLIPTFLGRKKT